MKKSFININHTLEISAETTFDMFRKSNLYEGQCDNRFFWLANICEIDDMSEKFKVGLWFKNNKIARVELYCMDDNIESEDERYDRGNKVLCRLQNNYDLKYKNIENSFDMRNNYCSILITF